SLEAGYGGAPQTGGTLSPPPTRHRIRSTHAISRHVFHVGTCDMFRRVDFGDGGAWSELRRRDGRPERTGRPPRTRRQSARSASRYESFVRLEAGRWKRRPRQCSWTPHNSLRSKLAL